MAVSLKPYIGTRDFYPEQMKFRNWMFAQKRLVCESFGYQDYDAPLLEMLDLYRTKSSEEIVSEQIYSFQDRSNRDVAIRPELTPSLARMFAARHQDFALPARLFNIGRFMRYERPGRGRLREFWQLNVDLLGANGILADAEILQLAIEILRSFGADHNHFELRFSDRRLMDAVIQASDETQLQKTSRLIDKKDKISVKQFEDELGTICAGDKKLQGRVFQLLELKIEDLQGLADSGRLPNEICESLSGLVAHLQQCGHGPELRFDPAIARGFNYYTGLVFEILDKHPDNRRALFGGGRYDRLIGMLGKQDVSAIGFGMGDVTFEQFLRSHNLAVPDPQKRQGVFITLMDKSRAAELQQIAAAIRMRGIAVELALESGKKIAKQFQLADRKSRRFVLIYGDDEAANQKISVKDLQNGEQIQLTLNELPEWLLTHDA